VVSRRFSKRNFFLDFRIFFLANNFQTGVFFLRMLEEMEYNRETSRHPVLSVKQDVHLPNVNLNAKGATYAG
jgi:hypothetical protein